VGKIERHSRQWHTRTAAIGVDEFVASRFNEWLLTTVNDVCS
jgi:hypothetical protein